MNKKLIYTGIWLCLGGIGLTASAWAVPGNSNGKGPNFQSVKKCLFNADQADVVLTKKLRYGHVNANEKLDDPTDDFYEICENAGFTAGCVAVTDPSNPAEQLAEDTTADGLGNQFIDPETGLVVEVEDSPGVPKLYSYTGLKIFGSTMGDTIYGTAGDDEICGNNGNDIILGEAGNDNLQGNNGSDRLVGGAGDDDLYGGNGGQDSLFGFYDDEDLPIDFPFDDCEDDAVGCDLDGDDDIDDFDTDSDTLDGGNGKDRLSGGPHHDDLSGGNGNDALDGDGGTDTIDGGKGNNTCTDLDTGDCDSVGTKGKKGGKKPSD